MGVDVFLILAIMEQQSLSQSTLSTVFLGTSVPCTFTFGRHPAHIIAFIDGPRPFFPCWLRLTVGPRPVTWFDVGPVLSLVGVQFIVQAIQEVLQHGILLRKYVLGQIEVHLSDVSKIGT